MVVWLSDAALFFISLAVIVELAAPVEWIELESARSSPNLVISKKYFGRKRFFCQATDAETGESYTGVMHGGLKRKRKRRSDRAECRITVGNKILMTKNFKVLSLDDSKQKVSYVFPSLPLGGPRDLSPISPPPGAVPCQDPDIPANRCFLGASVYGDGICEEGIGKIDLEERMIHMPILGARERCPFYTFLTVKKS